MLYLFDIDGTLVDTGGAGMAALNEATAQLYGHSGPALDLAGSTDLGVVETIHAHFGIQPTRQRFEDYLTVYLERLQWNLVHGGFHGKILAGVHELLSELSATPDASLGLLTGNAQAGAEVKMHHYGLSHHFPFGAYGCDHADRNQLGPIAMERAKLHSGRSFTPRETWIIGDTPKDIACAHAVGARCLAVATGRFTSAELRTHGADEVVETLADAIGLI